MTEYTKLSQTLQKTINMHVDDTLYPRKCLIKNVYDDGNVDAVVVIGEETLFTNLICFGDGKIGDEGIFIPLLNDYNQNIVITDNIKTYSKKEIDSKIDELNEAFETQLTADYIQSLIDALEKEDEKLNQRINNITADLDKVSADVLKKEDISNKVNSWSSTTTDTNYPSEKLVKDSLDEKTDVGHTHEDTEINSRYTDIEMSTIRLATLNDVLAYNEPFLRINRALEHMLDNWDDYD